MKISKFIKTLCDGDNNSLRDKVYINQINDWYQQDFENKKAKFFKKYAKECMESEIKYQIGERKERYVNNAR